MDVDKPDPILHGMDQSRSNYELNIGLDSLKVKRHVFLDQLDVLETILEKSVFNRSNTGFPSFFGAENLSEVRFEFNNACESMLAGLRAANKFKSKIEAAHRTNIEIATREYDRVKKKEKEYKKSLSAIRKAGFRAQAHHFTILGRYLDTDALKVEIIKFLNRFLKTLVDHFSITYFYDEPTPPFSIFSEFFIMDINIENLVDSIVSRKLRGAYSEDFDYKTVIKVSGFSVEFDEPTSRDLIEGFCELVFNANDTKIYDIMRSLTRYNEFLKRRIQVYNGMLEKQFHEACLRLSKRVPYKTVQKLNGLKIELVDADGESYSICLQMEGTGKSSGHFDNLPLDVATLSYKESPFRFVVVLEEAMFIPSKYGNDLFYMCSNLERKSNNSVFMESKVYPTVSKLVLGHNRDLSTLASDRVPGLGIIEFDASFLSSLHGIVVKRVPFTSLNLLEDVIGRIQQLHAINRLLNSVLYLKPPGARRESVENGEGVVRLRLAVSYNGTDTIYLNSPLENGNGILQIEICALLGGEVAASLERGGSNPVRREEFIPGYQDLRSKLSIPYLAAAGYLNKSSE